MNHRELGSELFLNVSQRQNSRCFDATKRKQVLESNRGWTTRHEDAEARGEKVKGQTSKRPTNPGDEKERGLSHATKKALGDVCAFLTCQSDAAIRLRV